MKRILLMLLLPLAASAEPFYVTVPGEGWSLKVDAPPMTRMGGEVKDRRLQFMASSLESGVTLSLHSETTGGGSSSECRDRYWPLSLGSPTVKTEIQLSGAGDFLFVTHLAEAELKGVKHKTANGHAYFVKNGLCMDLHVSHWPYQQGSEKRVEQILRSSVLVQ